MSVVELQQQLEIERARSRELEIVLDEEKLQREKVEEELKLIKVLHGELARKLEMEEEALVNKVCRRLNVLHSFEEALYCCCSKE
jgi:hypothetical protein